MKIETKREKEGKPIERQVYKYLEYYCYDCAAMTLEREDKKEVFCTGCGKKLR